MREWHWGAGSSHQRYFLKVEREIKFLTQEIKWEENEKSCWKGWRWMLTELKDSQNEKCKKYNIGGCHWNMKKIWKYRNMKKIWKYEKCKKYNIGGCHWKELQLGMHFANWRKYNLNILDTKSNPLWIIAEISSEIFLKNVQNAISMTRNTIWRR